MQLMLLLSGSARVRVCGVPRSVSRAAAVKPRASVPAKSSGYPAVCTPSPEPRAHTVSAPGLAPPATRLEDFEYHWKLILNFYQNYDDSSKIHIEDTRIPHHLNQMLQLIVDEEKEQQGGTVGPCLEAIVQRSICLLDALTVFAAADRPPGARALALTTSTTLLRRTRHACVNSPHVYRPLQRMLIQCSENPASPTEKDEVELLLTLCGLVRKEPGLANIFTTPFVEDKTSLLTIPEDILKIIPLKTKNQTPKKNPLFEVELPQNPLQNDNQVVLRACEGIMIVSSLPDDDIANLVTSCSPVCENLIEKLVAKYKCIPANTDPCDVDHLNITWGYVAHDFGDKSYHKFHGYRELTTFFSWLDYCDTLMKECHPIIAAHLARTFRQNFLEGTVECGLMDLHHTVLVTAIISKCLKVIDSTEFINGYSLKLDIDLLAYREAMKQLQHEDHVNEQISDILSHEGLTAIDKAESNENIHRIINSFLLLLPRAILSDPVGSDYEQYIHDAHRHYQHIKSLTTEGIIKLMTIAIDKLEPIQHKMRVRYSIRGGANLMLANIYSIPIQAWLDITSNFNWPTEYHYVDTAASSTHSYDSRPEADIHLDECLYQRKPIKNANTCCTDSENCSQTCNFSQKLVFKHQDDKTMSKMEEECFDEGPFLTMLFKLLAELPSHPYQINLQLTSIISKLAMLPHPYLHEYLLNPMLSTSKKTRTLFKTLQELAHKLTIEIPRIKNYRG
ncbi:Protein FAM160B1 [Eumeta japonica]|uniref:Protein FAM160B1 n=1 Tax=Eumeta variegata TaxID=151549 RepID=A0A4C1U537_EUMVA|nr:Protein FAM160B1 [Eumeta japonica]